MMKKFLLSTLSLLLMFSLAACAGGKPSSSVTESASTEKKTDTDPSGEYELYALEQDGYTIKASLLAAEMSLSLNKDGTGTMSSSDDSSDGDSSAEPTSLTWEFKDGELTITDGTTDTVCPCEKGILTINLAGMSKLIFAKEGADTSSIKCIKTSKKLAEMYKELSKREETSRQKILKKYNLKNDDKHFVYEENGTIICYNLEKGSATQMTGYTDCSTEESAKERSEAYDQASYDVTVDGTVLIVKQSASNLSLESLEKLYGDKKIDPE